MERNTPRYRSFQAVDLLLQPLQLPLLLDLLDHLVDNSLVFLQGGQMAYWPVVPRVILP